MSCFRRKTPYLALCGLSLPLCASASNLMLLPGYGAESSLMGGADIAVSRDSFAANNNPAGLAQISGQVLDLEVDPYTAEGASHTDNFGSYRRRIKNYYGVSGNFGYARHQPDSPYTFGVALVVQGGAGWVYKNMNTAFGTRDEATSLFGVVRLAPAASWRVNERLSLGATLALNYMSGAQTLFPNTSDAATGFSGINFKDASGYGLGLKLGMQYRPMDDVVIGVTYGTKSRIDLKGGTLRVNYTNTIPGQGIVRYDDAEMKGMALPREIGIGIAFRPMAPLLISVQEKWYDWSEALSSLTLTATQPRSAGVPQVLSMASQVGALDQHVYSLGARYDLSENTALMAGANYGRRAVPEQNLSPTFQTIHQKHYMAGVSHRFGDEWTAYFGVERYPQQMVSYNNPNLPFGPSVASHTGVMYHLQASRRWE